MQCGLHIIIHVTDCIFLASSLDVFCIHSYLLLVAHLPLHNEHLSLHWQKFNMSCCHKLTWKKYAQQSLLVLACNFNSKTCLLRFILFLQPNGHDHGTEANMKSMLAASMDHIQVLALWNFVLYFKFKILEHTGNYWILQCLLANLTFSWLDFM